MYNTKYMPLKATPYKYNETHTEMWGVRGGALRDLDEDEGTQIFR